MTTACAITAIFLVVILNGHEMRFVTKNLDAPPITILYAHDKQSDAITQECISEMFPPDLYRSPPTIDRNDVPCIILCVLKKFGIMTKEGVINIRNYYRRVQAIHRYDPRILVSDVGETCALSINSMSLDNDLCKKAKVFNDCTQLYAVSLKQADSL